MKRSEREREPYAHERGFRERIVKVYGGLSPQQRLVADYMLEHVRQVAFASVPELAAEAGVSEATIVRFAQSLGYDGFSGLKADLASALRDEVAPSSGRSPLLRRTPDADPIASVAALELENIQRSIEAMDRKVGKQVAERLGTAEHVYVFGVGISAHMADLFTYLLGQIGVRATPVSNRLTSPREVLAMMGRRDLLTVFSFPPYATPSLELVRDAKKLHVPTFVVTDKLTAPAARLADLVLCTRSDNMMYTNAIAAVTVLLNALVTWAALLAPERAARAVQHINALENES